jgi:hypothetical protein
MSKRFLAVMAVAAIALTGSLASAAGPNQEAALKGAAFIATTQQPDGGFGGFGPGQSFDAILALRSAGLDPNSVETAGKSPADYLAGVASTLEGAGLLGKAALAARALGLDPRDVAGINLLAALDATFDPATGRYAEDAFSQSLAILGSACTGNAVPSGALAALRSDRIAGAGWGFGGASDPDTTALGIQALIAAGSPVVDAAVQEALAYLRSIQGADGGWGFDPAGPSNTSSTAFVLQSLLAAGEPVDAAAYAKNGVTPVQFLLGQQAGDGSFAGFDPAFATNQVVPAIAGRTFCNAPTTVVDSEVAGPINPPGPPATGTGLAGSERAASYPLVAVALLVAAGAAGSCVGLSRHRR